MSEFRALADALIHLDGYGDAAPADPEDRARIPIQQLAERGYVVRAPYESPLLDRSPGNLRAIRRRPGLGTEEVALAAGVSVGTVRMVEKPDRRPHLQSIEAVARGLARLAEQR